MPFPNQFYYVAEQGTTQSQPHKKTLIFTDWQVSYWSAQQTELVLDKLRLLLEDGFSILLWQPDGLTELTTDTLADLPDIYDWASETRMVSPSTAIEQAVLQYQLTADQCLALDDYWLDVLVQGYDQTKPLPPRQIKTNTLRYLNFDFNKKKQWAAILKESDPKLEQIIHDKFSERSNGTVLDCANLFPDMKITKHYCNATLNHDQMQALFSNQTLGIQSRQASHTTSVGSVGENQQTNYTDLNFATNDLAMLTSLQIEDLKSSDASLFLFVITHASKLKSLTLSSSDINYEIKLQEGYLPNLNQLQIKNCSISDQNLVHLVTHAPQLQELSLDHVSGLNQAWTEEHSSLQFPNLVKLSFSHHHSSQDRSQQLAPHLPLQFMKQLLSSSSKLQRLELSSITRTNLPTIASSELYELRLTNFNINLRDISDAAQNLQTLDLSESSLSAHEGVKLEFPQLKKLNLVKITDSTTAFEQLINAAPQLKYLHLTELPACTLSNSLNCLKTLHLGTGLVEQAQFTQLIALAPNLKKLALNGCQVSLLDNEQLIAPQLSKLTWLSLPNSNITTDELKKLLRLLPNLKHLGLRNCKNLRVDEELNALLIKIPHVMGITVDSSERLHNQSDIPPVEPKEEVIKHTPSRNQPIITPPQPGFWTSLWHWFLNKLGILSCLFTSNATIDTMFDSSHQVMGQGLGKGTTGNNQILLIEPPSVSSIYSGVSSNNPDQASETAQLVEPKI